MTAHSSCKHSGKLSESSGSKTGSSVAGSVGTSVITVNTSVTPCSACPTLLKDKATNTVPGARVVPSSGDYSLPIVNP